MKDNTKIKFSKSSGFYMKTKADYFSENEKHLETAQKLNRLYSSQPKRVNCKICKLALPQSVDFTSHGIEYVFCKECNHLNGIYDDTSSFVKEIYIDSDGSDYASGYYDDNYLQRTNDIYIPKVDFLLTSLPKQELKILDIGCGSGYFVLGCLLRSITATGLDIGSASVKFGNEQIMHHCKESPLICVEEDAFFEEIKNTDANVVSAIGVIEHLREPHRFFEAFQLSNAKYLFYQVPMFSFSVVLENVLPNVFPRQLSGAHTHLFTEQSVKKLNNIIGIETLAEWRFGADVMDLYRSILVNLQLNQSSKKMIDYVSEGLGVKIDELQAVIDQNLFCSDIHVVAKKS